MIYFIADLHYGDEMIRRYENRPFESLEKMNQALVTNWNEKVCHKDTVYVLGDFAVKDLEKTVLRQLKGRKILVKGNHDMRTNQEYRDMGFEEVYDLPVILENFWILSHEPLYVNENMPYANVFGHVHASPLYKPFSAHHFCVSVERIQYAPISFDEVKRCVMEAVSAK